MKNRMIILFIIKPIYIYWLINLGVNNVNQIKNLLTILFYE